MSSTKLCVITGPTSGIGRATTLKMAELGYQLVLIGRNKQKLEKLKSNLIKKSQPSLVDYLVADFSQLEEVKAVANKVVEKFPKIDILINNAGVYQFKRKIVNNIELTLTVNHLAPFVLTLILIPSLKSSNFCRIINVASSGHYNAKYNLKDFNQDNGYEGLRVYFESKLANVLFTYKLDRLLRQEKSKITVNAVHPGLIRSNLARSVPIVGFLFRFYPKGKSPKEGAGNLIYVATSEELHGVTGKYFSKKKIKESSKISYNTDYQDELWELSENLTGIEFSY